MSQTFSRTKQAATGRHHRWRAVSRIDCGKLEERECSAAFSNICIGYENERAEPPVSHSDGEYQCVCVYTVSVRVGLVWM